MQSEGKKEETLMKWETVLNEDVPEKCWVYRLQQKVAEGINNGSKCKAME